MLLTVAKNNDIDMSLFKALKHAVVKNTAYVSETDAFLQGFDKKNPRKSQSQLKEIEKHRDIFNRQADNKIRWS